MIGRRAGIEIVTRRGRRERRVAAPQRRGAGPRHGEAGARREGAGDRRPAAAGGAIAHLAGGAAIAVGTRPGAAVGIRAVDQRVGIVGDAVIADGLGGLSAHPAAAAPACAAGHRVAVRVRAVAQAVAVVVHAVDAVLLQAGQREAPRPRAAAAEGGVAIGVRAVGGPVAVVVQAVAAGRLCAGGVPAGRGDARSAAPAVTVGIDAVDLPVSVAVDPIGAGLLVTGPAPAHRAGPAHLGVADGIRAIRARVAVVVLVVGADLRDAGADGRVAVVTVGRRREAVVIGVDRRAALDHQRHFRGGGGEGRRGQRRFLDGHGAGGAGLVRVAQRLHRDRGREFVAEDDHPQGRRPRDGHRARLLLEARVRRHHHLHAGRGDAGGDAGGEADAHVEIPLPGGRRRATHHTQTADHGTAERRAHGSPRIRLRTFAARKEQVYRHVGEFAPVGCKPAAERIGSRSPCPPSPSSSSPLRPVPSSIACSPAPPMTPIEPASRAR